MTPHPTLLETQTAIKLLSCVKASGSDSIPAKVYKADGLSLVEKLHEIFLQMWQQESIPQDFKDASKVPLYKRNGNRPNCDNHRGISLLSIAGKILARIILTVSHLDQGLLPESQCGFRKERGTIDMEFEERQLAEKCQEQNRDILY
jgi:hypothetical protein